MQAAGLSPLPGLTTPQGLPGIGSDRCSSRTPRPIRRKGSGAPRPPRGLGKRLQHVKEVVDQLPVAGPDFSYKQPRLGPTLSVYAVPEGLSGGSAALGLSIRANSQNKARSGISGISNQGRRFLKESLLLMDDFRERLCFWTITLPNEDYEGMAGTRQWPAFQRRCLDLLLRYLRENGDEALAVGAVEIGALRLRKTKRPMPHIHVVTTGWGRRRRDGQWLCSPKVMDQIIAKAAQYAGLERRLRLAASNVAPVRTSCHNYVSKYLTKDPPPDQMDLSDGWDELVPRQWWQASEGARALVEGHVYKLPVGFAAFLVNRQICLENARLLHARTVAIAHRQTITGPVPIEVTRFAFRSTEAIHAALEYYALWCRDPNVTIAGAGEMF